MARKSRKNKNSVFFKTAIYARLSVEDKNNDTIKNQIEVVKNFICEKEDLILFKIYIDDGKSGINFERTAFKSMMNDIVSKKIDCVVVKDLSRLGRNYLEGGIFIEKVFPYLNVRFLSVTDNFDSIYFDFSKLGYSMPLKNLINEIYIKDISTKEKTAKMSLMQEGRFFGQQAAYGYKKQENNKYKLVIDEEAAKIVRLIFNMVEEGKSDYRIAEYLNKNNIDSPTVYKIKNGLIKNNIKSNNWYKQAILRITTNKVYIGTLEHNKRINLLPKGKRKNLDMENWIVTENAHDAIISKEQFERVQKIREGKRNKHVISVKKDDEKDSIVFCGLCNKNLSCKKGMFLCSKHKGIKLYEYELIKILDKFLEIQNIIENNNDFKNQNIMILKSNAYKQFKNGYIDENKFIDLKKRYDKRLIEFKNVPILISKIYIFNINRVEINFKKGVK